MANVTREAGFVPIGIGHTQIITVVNLLRTSFANFMCFLAFYGGGDVCCVGGMKNGEINIKINFHAK